MTWKMAVTSASKETFQEHLYKILVIGEFGVGSLLFLSFERKGILLSFTSLVIFVTSWLLSIQLSKLSPITLTKVFLAFWNTVIYHYLFAVLGYLQMTPKHFVQRFVKKKFKKQKHKIRMKISNIHLKGCLPQLYMLLKFPFYRKNLDNTSIH